MNDAKLAQFAKQNYLNLESYRKNGQPVLTPVWFAEEDGVFYVYSLADAWKVKRVRNNPRVRIAPCDMRGNVKGEWVDAEARILAAAEAEHGHELLRQKYGWMKRIGEIFSRIRKREHAMIAIRIDRHPN
ncbi:MAG TPA: PPOX class F420-dependent oxidoreductase [Blastocatellia bacterium]|nr:PPOX class F420-dependent oxidoreductase [Blastocatellia bacterium]